jgi:hypothetical protein
MFTLVGLILFVFGILTNGSPIYDRSPGIHANLSWGLVLLDPGMTMFVLDGASRSVR